MKEQGYKPPMLNLPNILTTIRLFAAILLPVSFLYFTRPFADWAALILFVGAALTDWVDGFLARAWQQTSRLGAMLDPIADKAMVIIALTVIVGLTYAPSAGGLDPMIILPASLIIFREVFVSGLREFLGDQSSELKVTKIAKWKTTVQMVAIAMLFATGVFEHYLGMLSFGMDRDMIHQILTGAQDDLMGLNLHYKGMMFSWTGGVVMLWVAAILTIVTGWDYFRKSLPFLRGPK